MILATHAILSTYGFWLPNDPRGSWSDFVGSWELFRAGGTATKIDTTRSAAAHRHDVTARRAAKESLDRSPVVLDGEQAKLVAYGFADAAKSCGSEILACAVLPEHMHLVLTNGGIPFRRLLTRLKADATKRLKNAGRHPFVTADGTDPPPMWARGGWNVFLDSDEAIFRSIAYVEENPGKEGKPRQRWSFVVKYNPSRSLSVAAKDDLAATDRERAANPLWHPFAPMRAFRDEDPPVITNADGFELITADGKRLLDGVSSLWCNVHGHRVPEIDEAVKAQLDRVAHSTLLGLRQDTADAFAERLVDVTPANLTKVFYSDAGATAVEVALKMAFQYHRQKSPDGERRRKYFKMVDAYHGDTVGTNSVGGIELFHQVYGDLFFDTIPVPCPYTLRPPDGHDAESYTAWATAEMERLVTAYAGEAAAFVIEPLVQGAAGILTHPPGYLRKVREITRMHSVPLICDEVATGFCKTGSLFAVEQEGVEPDFLCLAKGITGGYLPLAATLTTDEIYDAFLGEPHEGKTFFHGHTYTGNALGCAAGLASLDLVERNDIVGHVTGLDAVFDEELSTLADHPHVGAVRRRGVMTGIELVADRGTLTPFSAELRMGHRVTLAARERGVMIRPLGDVVVLMPAVAMPADDVQRLIRVTIDAIDAAVAS